MVHNGTGHEALVDGKGKWNKANWTVMHPMHDLLSHLLMDDMKKFLASFFKPSEGPHVHKLLVKGKVRAGAMWDLAIRAAEKLGDLEKKFQDMTVKDDDAMKKAAEQRRRDKIQEAMAKRKRESSTPDSKGRKAKAIKL